MSEREEVLEICHKYLLRVKKSGNDNVMALCPFHDNVNSPAFSMSISTGLWFCFGCHAKGNLKSFLSRMGVGSAELHYRYQRLIDSVAESMPIHMDPLRPKVIEQEPLDEGLLGIFNTCPLALLEEGFSEEALCHFEVGYDGVHKRITYPLRDLHGNLVGISGRNLEAGYGRYKIYDKEYVAFGLPKRDQINKRILLWNAHNVLPSLHHQRGGAVLVVEGFKAAIWAYQAGITEVVALLGSTMTEQQKWILAHLGVRVYLMLDNDLAGQQGTQEIGKELSNILDTRIVSYDAVQPDGLEPEHLIQAVENAQDYHSWRIQNVLRKA